MSVNANGEDYWTVTKGGDADDGCCCPAETDDDGDDDDDYYVDVDQELSDAESCDERRCRGKREWALINSCWQLIEGYYLRFQANVKTLVENKYFQQALLGAILINTLSMGIEYHNQVQYCMPQYNSTNPADR